MALSNKEHSLHLCVPMVIDEHYIYILKISLYIYIIISYIYMIWCKVRTQHGSQTQSTSEGIAPVFLDAEDRSMRMLLPWNRRIKPQSPHFCKLFRRYDSKPGSFWMPNMKKVWLGPQKSYFQRRAICNMYKNGRWRRMLSWAPLCLW